MTLWTGRLALLLALLLGLGACADRHEELAQWMEDQRRQARPRVDPLQAPRQFEPEAYDVTQLVEPFSPQKLIVALRRETGQSSSLLQGEMNRRREPLEAFPLDSMTMVGSLMRGGQPRALLRVEGLLYQLKVGDYIGQNYGRITAITETEVTLREVVQDAAGDWVERVANLQLQSKAP